MNLALWLERAAAAQGHLPSIGVGNRTIRTFRDSAVRVMTLAGAMRDGLNLKPGDRVAVFAKNGPDYAETLYAIWWAGLTAVPVNAKLHRSEVQYILEHSGARLVFTSDDVAETTAQGLPDAVPLISFGSAQHQALLHAEGRPLQEAAPDDLAWLFYTSGTTGRPKGAMLTHRNLMAMTWGYLSCIDRLQPGGAVLHAAPMSHGSGLYILPHLARGCCQVTPESGGFDPAEIFDTIAAWPGTSMFAAPTMVNRLTRHTGPCPTDNLRALIYGGAPMYVEDAQAALERLGPKLVQIYGQGESPMNITCLERETIADTTQPRYLERLGSAGQPYPNVEVLVVDENDVPVPQGETGEIITRSDSVMVGYWDNPEATAETLRGGWLHTGDIGRFDADGYLSLMDRSKDVVISGGTNIYPREIEEVLLNHPDVQEVSVIGRRDDEWGEIVVAYVVGTAPPKDLDALCLEKIARFKRPKDYIYLESLPKNNYGKVLKTELRQADAQR
ncbi:MULTISPECIES: AMP-binding protein [unclassified Hwanghaeella]|uniref:AMP-binding protein n=1 Tax=unclassified Hwanghaeella TaxID=2605944 RepID=UPI000C991CB5|nr:AMP-dependent synthetase [Rhodospirillales bacterium]